MDAPGGRGRKSAERERLASIPPLSPDVRALRCEWQAQEHQREVLWHDDGIDVIVGGLGSGKSDVGAYKLLRWATRPPRDVSGKPSQWLALGPDYYRLVRSMFREKLRDGLLRRCTVRYEDLVLRYVEHPHPEIVLWNGVTILGRSGKDPDDLRGLIPMGVWMDEAEQQYEEAFQIACSRMRSAGALRMIVTTSPKGASRSWTRRLVSGKDCAYNKLREQVDVRAFRWHSKANTYNTGNVTDAIGTILNAGQEGMSDQELAGIYLGTEEAPALGGFDARKAFGGDVELTREDIFAPVVGVDLGRARDYTWITVLGPRGHVLFMERFNWSSAPERIREADFLRLVDKRVLMAVAAFGCRIIKADTAFYGEGWAHAMTQTLERLRRFPNESDTEWFGEALVDRLRGRKVEIEGYMTASKSKRGKALMELRRAISNGDICVPARWRSRGSAWRTVDHTLELRREIENLVPEEQAGGAWLFPCPPGANDDGPVSLALARDAYATDTLPTGPRRSYKHFAPGTRSGAGKSGGYRF